RAHRRDGVSGPANDDGGVGGVVRRGVDMAGDSAHRGRVAVARGGDGGGGGGVGEGDSGAGRLQAARPVAVPHSGCGGGRRAWLRAGGRGRPRTAPGRAPRRALRAGGGRGAAVAAVAALAGADGGVVAVVGDVARRRAALEEALEPARLGAERAVIGGSRCEL